jgi:hypothetical protein
MGTYVGAAAQDSERLAADRAWVGWGVAAAVTGMLAWLAGFALTPLDAKLDKGEQHLVQVVRAHTGQLYAAGLLAVLGAVLLAAFFAVLTRLVPEGNPGWGLLRVSLAGCVMTQTMVAIGASFGLAGPHAAAGNAGAGLAALGWRALADVPGLRCADHLVHGDRGAGAAAGRAVPALGVRPELALGRSARPGAVHARPARPLRGGRDHRRARPAHHRHLDPRPGRHPAAIAAGSRPGRLRNRRVTKGTEGRAVT